MPEELKKHLQNLPAKQEISELPHWVKLASASQLFDNLTAKEAAKRFNRGEQTLHKHNQSPAGKKWKAELEKIAEDPKEVARLILRSSISFVALEYLAAFSAAVEAGDYAEVARMSRDLLDREDIIGVAKSKQAQIAPQINITLWGSPEPVVVEEIPEADVEVLEE
jgi:hypothetical protein